MPAGQAAAASAWLIAMSVPADEHDMARIIGIVSGLVVTMLATFTVWFFLMAATWSRIHGGTSELMLLILTTLVTPSPPLSGFLAGRAIDGEWRRREPIPGTDPIHLNCPHCGVG